MTTGLAVDQGGDISFEGYGDIDVSSLSITDDSTGKVTIDAPASVSDYTIKLPSSQGASGTTLLNDGSGNLSWTANNVYSNAVTGYVDIGSVRICYGIFSLYSDSPLTVNLPASYSNTSFSVNVSSQPDTTNWTGSDNIGVPIKITSKTTSSFSIDRDNDMTGVVFVNWQTMGTKA